VDGDRRAIRNGGGFEMSIDWIQSIAIIIIIVAMIVNEYRKG
jgi:hypothetical protein